MYCPECGAQMYQGPNGDWACGSCGTSSVAGVPVYTTSLCYECQSEVVDGPAGGYVCGACGHTVEPRGAIRAHLERQRARRLARQRAQDP
jgi:uncharacterized Zn finger protein (UPF0148 family)